MKIKEGYVTCKVGDSSVILATGNTSMQLNGLVTLNETGEFIWNLLLKETTVEEAVQAVMHEYDVDRATAQADVAEFVQKLERAGFLA